MYYYAWDDLSCNISDHALQLCVCSLSGRYLLLIVVRCCVAWPLVCRCISVQRQSNDETLQVFNEASLLDFRHVATLSCSFSLLYTCHQFYGILPFFNFGFS
jgi:hypothetical protein